MPSSRLFTLLLAVAGASATLLDTTVLAHRALSNHLQSRQSTALDPTTFPAQCQRTCTPIINTLNTCNTRTPTQQLSCLCTSSNGSALKGCLDCLVSVLPSQSQVTQAQSVLDTFNTNCREFNLPPYTVNNPAGNGPSNPPVSFPPTPSTPSTPPPSVPSQPPSNPAPPSQPSSGPGNPSPLNPNPPTTPRPSQPAPSPSGNLNGNGNGGNGNNNNNPVNDPFAKNGGVANQVSFGAVLGVAALALVL
jgi:hypothetical protein